jgi:hypothetical protein
MIPDVDICFLEVPVRVIFGDDKMAVRCVAFAQDLSTKSL